MKHQLFYVVIRPILSLSNSYELLQTIKLTTFLLCETNHLSDRTYL